MTREEALEIVGDRATWELRNMIKALSNGVSMFLNAPEDERRLEAARVILRERTRS